MWEKNLNALMVLILAGVLLSAFSVQIFLHEQPCPLCMLQRLGMLGVATGALMNMKFGVSTSHYGLSLLSALMGGFVALRHIFLHVCPQFPAYGTPVFGLSLYTWSFIVFVCVVTYIALLMIIFNKREKSHGKGQMMNGWCRFASCMILLVALANVATTFAQCKWGPCLG